MDRHQAIALRVRSLHGHTVDQSLLDEAIRVIQATNEPVRRNAVRKAKRSTAPAASEGSENLRVPPAIELEPAALADTPWALVKPGVKGDSPASLA